MTAATVLRTSGRRRVSSIELATLEDGKVSASVTQPCDLVLMSGGLTPSVHLFSQSRGSLRWDETLQAFLPGAPAERVRCAGACRGVYALAAALADGAAAGAAAAREATDPARRGVCPAAALERTAPAPRPLRLRRPPPRRTSPPRASPVPCPAQEARAGARSSTGRTT